MPANKARARVFAAIVAHCLPPKAGESPLAAADQWLRITPTQLAILRQWAAGRFKADWRGHALDAAEIPDAPSRRDTIDRAVLDACADYCRRDARVARITGVTGRDGAYLSELLLGKG